MTIYMDQDITHTPVIQFAYHLLGEAHELFDGVRSIPRFEQLF